MTHEIAGARGEIGDPQATVARAQAWAADHGATVLLADAAVVFGRDHLESAVRHALRSRESGANVARDLGLEALRYLCAQRQVADAIRVGGIKGTTEAIAVVVFGASADAFLGHMGFVRSDDVLEPTGKSLRILGLTQAEEKTVAAAHVADLALERVALLDIEK